MTQTIAYRDDLEAARLRLLDLEREHAELKARNAELEMRKRRELTDGRRTR